MRTCKPNLKIMIDIGFQLAPNTYFKFSNVLFSFIQILIFLFILTSHEAFRALRVFTIKLLKFQIHDISGFRQTPGIGRALINTPGVMRVFLFRLQIQDQDFRNAHSLFFCSLSQELLVPRDFVDF